MNINGENGLACITPITKSSHTTTLRPLPHMFVLKDLVIGLVLLALFIRPN